ncbi:MAG: hypothetical protein N5P05_004433 (plasmid) [Chroococcopsis gigantea SAG 12.99]|jgi:hypothetical protein|nr:hypothetical protein [Chlorogloea purpurea SAG 13.99]MDV3002778.1 hypothetical protein [Chroococcopsis gigantea SAG 12.99]
MTHCWICKQSADTAEHRIKKSDLVNLFGSGSYKDENGVVLVRGTQQIPILGPNSKKIKYDKNLCAKCNNDLSQPFDRAYETFINYICQNEDLILKRRFIDFQEVYEDDFVVSQRNLYKYFVKSFGCRLNDGKLPIPKDLLSLFPKTSFKTGLRITFSVCEDHLLFFKSLKIAGKGDIMTLIYPPSKETKPTFQERIKAKINSRIRPLQYRWSEQFKWLYVWYWYNWMPDGQLGSTWVADSQFIYLGSFETLTDEYRKQLLESR